MPRFTGLVDGAKEKAALADLRSMKTAVDLHYVESGSWPTADNGDTEGTIKTVLNRSGIRWGNLPDPWGNPYVYRVGSGYIIFTTRDNTTYYFVTDRHVPTKGPYPDGYPTSGGVPSLLGGGVPAGAPSPEPEPPTVDTVGATDITTSSATLLMTYDFKDYGSGQVRFVYGPSGGDYGYTSWVDKAGSGSYAETISDLASNTTYWFKAQLKYGTTVVEGRELSFTTLKLTPTVETKPATNVTATSATLNMHYDFRDYSSGQVRFAYRRSADPDYQYTSWTDRAGSGTYAENISGLASNTTYYFKAQLKYGTTEVEGLELSFTTMAAPTVTTLPATGVTKRSATLNMAYDFKDYGSGQVQFAYKRSGGTYTYTSWVDRAGSGTYAETITGLASKTTYYFRARLKYGTTEVEGSELFFTTK